MSTNSQIAFGPLGETVVIPADSVAPAGVQALVASKFDAQSTGQYRIINSSENIVFLGVGPTAAVATANAVVSAYLAFDPAPISAVAVTV